MIKRYDYGEFIENGLEQRDDGDFMKVADLPDALNKFAAPFESMHVCKIINGKAAMFFTESEYNQLRALRAAATGGTDGP